MTFPIVRYINILCVMWQIAVGLGHVFLGLIAILLLLHFGLAFNNIRSVNCEKNNQFIVRSNPSKLKSAS